MDIFLQPSSFKNRWLYSSKKMTSDSRKIFNYMTRLAVFLFVVANINGDVCQTYAGGAVYPRETSGKSSGHHSLQWTKAMSILYTFNIY